MEETVLTVFNEMKVRKAHCNEEEKSKRKKAVMFCLSDDKKHIIMEQGQEILQGDEGDPYLKFVKMLPPNDCRYALYDATYETKETKKEDLVFIFWYVFDLAFFEVYLFQHCIKGLAGFLACLIRVGAEGRSS